MRIGIDARLLCEPLTGIGRYTKELCQALTAYADHLYLYTPKALPASQLDLSNTTLRSGRSRARIGKMLWSQSVLPWWAMQDEVDVFWGTTHRLPRFLPSSMPRVVTIHDLVWKFAAETMRPTSRFLESRLMPPAIRAADRIIADSQSTANDICEVFPQARDKVRVVHLGVSELVDSEGIDSLRPLGIDGPYFLFVGTLEPRKNLRRLLNAYARLSPSIRARAKCVIAGGKGWGGVDLKQLRTDLGLDRDVVLTGYVSDVQLATLYAHAKFLVMPSLYEGFGLPLIESMSRGVPVLTSDCSSLPEVAGEAGLLVDPQDEWSIGGGLSVLLTDEARLASLAGHARPNAQRFTWAKAASETMKVFEEAIHTRQADHPGRS